jgi:uncharacterized protein HemY
LILASKGSHYQRQEAVRLLRKIADSPSEVGIGASRVQAALMFEMASKYDELTESKQKQFDKGQYLDEARRIFKRLADRDDPSLIDLTRYFGFLFSIQDDGDLEKARGIVDRLKATPGAAMEVLKIEMILAQENGDKDKLPSIVDQWARDTASSVDSGIAEGSVEIVAGDTMMRAGFVDKGLSWFKRAYEANSDSFANYIRALATADKHTEAAEIAAARYDAKPSATAAVFLVESLLELDLKLIEPRYTKILEEAAKAYPDNAALYDSLATLAMQKGENEKAITLYLKALRNDGRRLRPLNNLAMIFAEIPGRELEGLPHIDNAIKLAGENPELLDTKGTVLLRGRKLQEARDVFKKAIEQGTEGNMPRYQFHLVQTLIELGEGKQAEKAWSEIEFDKLDRRGLTPDERDNINELHQRFKTRPETIGKGDLTPATQT